MRVLLVLSGLGGWAGLTLVFGSIRWFQRRGIAERVGPYVPAGAHVLRRSGVLSVATFRDAIGPIARTAGSRLARLLGGQDDLDRKLRRIHAELDATEFRVRQLGWSLAGFAIGGMFALAIRSPAAAAAVMAFGGMLLAFAFVEQRLTAASDRHRSTVRRQMPVVAEQVGMLLASGYSVTGALVRIAERGKGAVSQDLARVVARVRQGVGEQQALLEWAELAHVDAVERFVGVLSLDRQSSDLGRLIATEARNIRRDLHRDLLATIDKRGQQVWIPVTVATLLPGAIFIGVPFTAALARFIGG